MEPLQCAAHQYPPCSYPHADDGTDVDADASVAYCKWSAGYVHAALWKLVAYWSKGLHE
jgi:hypothetical protein